MGTAIILNPGQKFGRLTVVKFEGSNSRGLRTYKCLCDCGNVGYWTPGALVSGNTKSCGCLNRDLKSSPKKHGFARRGSLRRKEYATWRQIISRCKPHNQKHKYYYDRGIQVYDGWIGEGGFLRFLEHIGPCPPYKCSIDRIDNDKGYEPGNVRWATPLEQGRNQRHRVLLEYVPDEQLRAECLKRNKTRAPAMLGVVLS
jgi:hypothetical protein